MQNEALSLAAVLLIGPGTCRSSGGYSVESRQVYLTFKISPERNSRGLLILLRRVLFQGSHLLQILLKALWLTDKLFALLTLSFSVRFFFVKNVLLNFKMSQMYVSHSCVAVDLGKIL